MGSLKVILCSLAVVIGLFLNSSLLIAQSSAGSDLTQLQELISSAGLSADEHKALDLALGVTSVQDLENQFADKLATSYTLRFADFNANPGEVAGKEEALDFLRRTPELVGSATDKLIAAGGGIFSESDIQRRISQSGILGAYENWQSELTSVSMSGVDRSKLALRGITVDTRNAIGALGALGEVFVPVDDVFQSADLASVALRAGQNADKGLSLIGGIAAIIGSTKDGRISGSTILELAKLLESSGFISDGDGAWGALQDLKRDSSGLKEVRALQTEVSSERALRALQNSENALIKKQLSSIGQIVKLLAKPFPGLSDVAGFAVAYGKAQFESDYNQQAAQLIMRNIEIGFDLKAGQEYLDEFDRSQVFESMEDDLQVDLVIGQSPLPGQANPTEETTPEFPTGSEQTTTDTGLFVKTGEDGNPVLEGDAGENTPIPEEIARPAEPAKPVEPELVPISPPKTSKQIGFITAANAIPTSTFLLTHGATATVTDNGSVKTVLSSTDGDLSVTATTPAQETFQYLDWGTFSGAVSFKDTNSNETHSLERLRWLHGNATPESYFANRTGAGTWKGNVYGDYARNGTSDTFYDAVTGDLTFSINFANNSVVGSLVTNTLLTLPNNVRVSFAPRKFTLSGRFLSGLPGDSGVAGAGIKTQLNGARLDGELGGVFFGANAEEFGGTFWYTDPDGGASGIVSGRRDVDAPNRFLAMEDVVYTMDRNYRCLGIGCSYGNILQNSVWGEWSIGAPVKTTTISGKEIGRDRQIQTVTGSKPTINTASLGAYEYTSWGVWVTEETQIYHLKGQQRTEYWVAGEATNPGNLPRVGTAQYNGEMMGTVGGRKHRSAAETRVNGTIQFDVDFASQTLSGSYQAPGWASGTIASMDIVENSGKMEFSGAMTHSGSGGGGSLAGTFFGLQGQEMGGVWNSGNAGGVFRAKK